MSLSSMTGFGSAEKKFSHFSVQAEIKSVNHRFKDLRFRMSSSLNALEMSLRKKLEKFFKRGSFDIFLSVKFEQSQNLHSLLDLEKITQFSSSMKNILEPLGISCQVSLTDFLKSEFQKDKSSLYSDEVLKAVQEVFEQAMGQLKSSRQHEGAQLLINIQQHLQDFQQRVDIISRHTEDFHKDQQAKLSQKLGELSEDQTGRLHQELIYYLERMDIQEELNRIAAHLLRFQELFKSSEPVGRELDFLVQELGRETNTIGSKSSYKEISEAIVQMKVFLEKVREQALNIE